MASTYVSIPDKAQRHTHMAAIWHKPYQISLVVKKEKLQLKPCWATKFLTTFHSLSVYSYLVSWRWRSRSAGTSVPTDLALHFQQLWCLELMCHIDSLCMIISLFLKALFNNEVKLMEGSGSSYLDHQSFHFWSLLIKMKACMAWRAALVPIILLQMQLHANCFYWSRSQALKPNKWRQLQTVNIFDCQNDNLWCKFNINGCENVMKKMLCFGNLI